MNITKYAHISLPLILLTATVIVALAFSKIRYLSLPISQTFATFALILPTVAAASLQGIRILLKTSWKERKISFNLPLLALIIIQIIYETVIATLSLTYIVPESALNCALGERWQELFMNKDEQAIRAIQDSFDCCGFKTTKDRAWPFSNDKPSSCTQTYGRSQSCLAPWRRSEKTNASLIFLIVVVVFLTKVSAMIFIFMKNAGIKKRQLLTFEGEDPEEDQQSSFGRLLIKDNNPRDAFTDAEAENLPSENQGLNHVDQKSARNPALPEIRNEWDTEASSS
ncbi:hypothetical protein HI914_04220 [Erysiphe necator]|nr:hypothetical protein HI914_04220 [Erysiphe necator]